MAGLLGQPMAWARLNARLTGRVALLALAIQLVSAFGHFHPEWAGIPTTVSDAAHDHAGPGHDNDQDHHGKQPDTCTVCTAASLAQAFTAPSAPALPVLTHVTLDLPGIATAPAADDPRRGPFQSRAPPRS